MKNVEGKVAFITGGASGMGLGMARVFSKAGMKVVIADVHRDHLDSAMEKFRGANPGVHALQVDVADRAAMTRAADEAERVFGKVHVLCNNAGVGIVGPILEATYDDWDWGMGVNLGGVINGVQTFASRIRKHGEGGHIVTTASMSGLLGGVAGIYATAKYAVVGFMETLRPELEPFGIGVSVFCPGLVNTNIHEVEKHRPAQYGNTTYRAPSEKRAQFMKAKILPSGMDPLEVGERVLRGIRRNDLYILTHPEYEPGLRERFAAILASFPVEGPPPPARVAAEAVVLRHPMFAAERDRLLRERAKHRGAGRLVSGARSTKVKKKRAARQAVRRRGSK
jgi:NAD(P)-dependent dehydrogenase (short-subunit alcohol dehydrogenase family)